MKITIEKSEKNLQLLRSLASKNREDRFKAQESLAQFIGPVIQEVINNAPTVSSWFETFEFNEYDDQSIPLDLYTDVGEEDYLRVWSQTDAGGLAFNFPTPPTNELKFHTYRLDSAIAFKEKYARQSRLDVISKSMSRMAQEVLIKQEKNAAIVLLTALAKAESELKPGDSTKTKHILRSHTANELKLSDFLKLFTLHKRIRSSWSKGTPSSAQGRGLTDLIISPEVEEYLKSLSFNAVNTRGGVRTGSGTEATEVAVTLTEEQRNRIFESAGVPEFYGVNLTVINELGVGYKWNELFKAVAGSISYPGHYGGGSAGAFDKATEEIAIGLDLATMTSLIRPVAVDTDSQSQFIVEPDDQFVRRSGNIGFFGYLEEGRVLLDDRVLSGLII